MSHLDTRFGTNQVTVWRLGNRDIYGSPQFVLLGVFGATWKSGSGVKRDDQGVEFVPRDIYYFGENAAVRRGDMIQRGDQSSGQPGGDVVRMTDTYDNSFFGWSDTFVVMTE